MAKKLGRGTLQKDAKAKHQRRNGTIGAPNDGFAQCICGKAYLAPLSTVQVGIYNVTFEPGCPEQLSIHHCCKGGGQIAHLRGRPGLLSGIEQSSAGSYIRQIMVDIPPVKHWL